MSWGHLARHVAIAMGILFLVTVVLVLVTRIVLFEL